MNEAATNLEPDQSLHDQGMRRMSGYYALFRLCRRMRCRRAAACRGFPRECLSRYMPLVPEEALAFMIGLDEARKLGLPFEVALAQLKEEHAALARWHETISR